jgi:hypothetical protein
VVIDAGDKAVQDAARRLVGLLRLTLGDPGDADCAMQQIAPDVSRPENFGLRTESPAAQSIHLPQPILGHGKAQSKVQVDGRRGVHVRHSGMVAQDLDPAADRRVEYGIGRWQTSAQHCVVQFGSHDRMVCRMLAETCQV